MKDLPLDPEMREVLRLSAGLPGFTDIVARTPLERVPALYKAGRAHWNGGAPPVEAVRDLQMAFDGRELRLRLYHPHPWLRLPVIVYLHGGGYIMGDLDTHDGIMRRLALAADAAVVGLDYTLAPARRFPVQIEEATAAVAFLAGEADRLNIDPGALGLAGDSAGAALSVGTCYELLALGQPQPAALLLYYGAYGLTDSPSRRAFAGPDSGLPPEDLDLYRRCYIGDDWQRRRDPRLDMLSGPLERLPPCFILSADLDPLRDDSAALAELLGQRDIRAEWQNVEGVLHGFLHYGRVMRKSRQAIQAGADFFNRVLER